MNDQGKMNQQPYVRMVIGEVYADSMVSEFLKIWNEEAQHMHAEGGLIEARLMTEEGGPLVVIETVFATRDDCLRHHCAPAYRRFVARTQYLLIGSFVTRLFQQAAYHQIRFRGR